MGAYPAGRVGIGEKPISQVLCSPGVTEVTREDHEAVGKNTSQDAETVAAALSVSLSPKEFPGTWARAHIPGLAGVLAG